MLRTEAQSAASTRSAGCGGPAHPKMGVGKRQTRKTRASHYFPRKMLADFIAGIGHAYRRYASVQRFLERQGAATEVNPFFDEGAKRGINLKRFAPEFLESEAIFDLEYKTTGSRFARSASQSLGLIVRMVRSWCADAVAVGLFEGIFFP
jgi:hypothetical protein